MALLAERVLCFSPLACWKIRPCRLTEVLSYFSFVHFQFSLVRIAVHLYKAEILSIFSFHIKTRNPKILHSGFESVDNITIHALKYAMKRTVKLYGKQ